MPHATQVTSLGNLLVWIQLKLHGRVACWATTRVLLAVVRLAVKMAAGEVIGVELVC